MNREIATTVVTRILMLLLGLVTSVITSRWLGPTGRGQYGVVITFSAIIVQFSNFGLAPTVTYQLAADKARFAALLRNVIWISFVGGGLISLTASLTVLWLKLLPVLLPSFVVMGALIAPALLFIMLGSNLLIGLGCIKIYNLFQIGSCFALLSIILIAWALKGGLFGCVEATLVSWTFAATCLLWQLWRMGGHGWRFDWDLFREGIGYSGRVYVICLLGYVLLRINVITLERLSTSEQTGYYAVALQAFDLLMILPNSVGLMLFPRLVGNASARWHITQKSLLGVSASMFAICVVAAVLIGPAVRLAFGEAFLPAAPVLLAMLPAAFFASLTTILSQYLGACGMPRILVGVWLVGVLAMFGASYVLIPALAAVGAAIALSIASGLVLLQMLIVTRAHRTMPASEGKPDPRALLRAA